VRGGPLDAASRCRDRLREPHPKPSLSSVSLIPEQAASFVREDLARSFAETLREQGRLVRMELLEQKSEGDLRVYRYRVTYPHLTLFAVFKIDPQNRITAWSLTD
jgi:cytosine/adenosine deaminase-related metal-dependent hydrolase